MNMLLILEELNDTSTGQFMYTMFLAFAEFERNMILERTREGKEVARLDPDWKDGRQRMTIPGFLDCLHSVERGEKTVTECCTELGISRGTWYSRMKEIA